MKTTFALPLALSALSLLGAVGGASAQSFSVGWFTIAGGGGASSGSNYAISGTIGQPDAGAMSGGNYSLAGGFWGVPPTPAAPLLSITRSTAVTVSVSWNSPATGWVLDQATTPPGSGTPAPWTPVPLPYVTNSTTISITVPAPTGTRFYRLRQP